jgi:hypothetical protein
MILISFTRRLILLHLFSRGRFGLLLPFLLRSAPCVTGTDLGGILREVQVFFKKNFKKKIAGIQLSTGLFEKYS